MLYDSESYIYRFEEEEVIQWRGDSYVTRLCEQKEDVMFLSKIQLTSAVLVLSVAFIMCR